MTATAGRSLWDLSHTLQSGMPVYPGDEPASFVHTHTVAEHGFEQSLYHLTNHTGTHLDGPRHFLSKGRDLASYEPERFVVERAWTLHGESAPAVDVPMLEQGLPRLRAGDAVILVTGSWRLWGDLAYFGPFPTLTNAGADWLIDHGVRLLAVDAASADPVGTDRYPIHHRLLAGDCLIVENLAYDPALPNPATLIALPLKVKDSNGAPARVIAWAASR